MTAEKKTKVNSIEAGNSYFLHDLFGQLNTRSTRNKEENVENPFKMLILISLNAKILKHNAICLMVWSNHNLAAGFNNQPKPRQKAEKKIRHSKLLCVLLQQLSLLKPIACLENLQLRDLKCKTINIMFVEKLAKHAIIKLQCNRNSFVLPI